MEQEFKKWLSSQITQKGNKFSDDQIKNLCNDLRETIPNWKKVEQSTSLFNILDYEVINELYSRCRAGGDLKELSWDVGHHRPSNALRRYKEFLKQRQQRGNGKDIFAWVKWFNELTIAISKEDETTLEEKINKIFEKESVIIDYKRSDPFSFFYFLVTKNRKKKREEFFNNTKEAFNITSPLPDFKDNDCWNFPTPPAIANTLYSSTKQYEPTLLWSFFQQIIAIKNIDELESKLRDNQFVTNFQSVLSLDSVGVAKLTQTLFLINPNIFFPIDGVLKSIVGELLKNSSIAIIKGIEQLKDSISEKGFSTYFEIMKDIRALYPDKKLYEINHELWELSKQIEDDNMDDKSQNKNEVLHMENQILYGPPGTGKTFSTVGKALEILEKTATDEQKQKIKEIKNKNIKSIRQLKEVFESQVEFVTFHQSFSYEDFVEGLKANSDGNNITYDIESGIFKLICENAKNSGNDSLEKLNEAIEKLKEQVEEVPLKLETLAHQKPYILTYKGNKAFYAKPDAGKYSNPVSIDSIVKLYKNPEVKSGDDGVHFKIYTLPVIEYLKENFKLLDYQEKTDKKPHVLIIDEINRGNISRIFGELITLIEPSKRAGNDETISVQLPYSKKPFSVPKNLYIIGTMNTADRSLALMDTALRRRFDFTEMMPDPKLVTGKFDGIDLQKILESINERIEILYDREHTIGHSFLMNINTLPELRNAFKNKILPLLEEYFYDDFKKIRLVLNDTDKFYKKKEVKLGEFEKTIYRKQTIDSLEADAFTRIYEPIPNEE